jgi:hypothetical protein
MSVPTSISRNGLLAIAATLAIGTAGSTPAAPVGHVVVGGGYHGGSYRGWSGGHAFYGGGWRGGYGGVWRGGYYGPWRGGWAGWRGGCCGWGYYPWVGLGWSVAVLPYGYQTLWWGGWPYYYANNYYYVYDANAGQYEAVQPPASGTTPPSSSSPPSSRGPSGNGRWTDLYAYPKGGQSTEQQIKDRDECRKWAVEQSGFDPSQPTHDSGNDWAAKRDSYLRAEGACLQARNYSVK